MHHWCCSVLDFQGHWLRAIRTASAVVIYCQYTLQNAHSATVQEPTLLPDARLRSCRINAGWRGCNKFCLTAGGCWLQLLSSVHSGCQEHHCGHCSQPERRCGLCSGRCCDYSRCCQQHTGELRRSWHSKGMLRACRDCTVHQKHALLTHCGSSLGCRFTFADLSSNLPACGLLLS